MDSPYVIKNANAPSSFSLILKDTPHFTGIMPTPGFHPVPGFDPVPGFEPVPGFDPASAYCPQGNHPAVARPQPIGYSIYYHQVSAAVPIMLFIYNDKTKRYFDEN